MKARNGSDVPRTRSEGPCHEAVGVVDEVGDNHADDLLREPGDGGRVSGSRVRRGTT